VKTQGEGEEAQRESDAASACGGGHEPDLLLQRWVGFVFHDSGSEAMSPFLLGFLGLLLFAGRIGPVLPSHVLALFVSWNLLRSRRTVPDSGACVVLKVRWWW
jgi:hypothetical protein